MKIFFLSSILLALFTSTGFASKGADIQIVQSIPEETDLAQKDLPYAKDVWLEMIRGARNTIDLAQFYISSEPGQALEEVIEELARAGQRGIKIRVLVSKDLIKEYASTYEQMRKLKNTTIKIYDIEKLSNGGILHAKYWIIDGKEYYVGSQNFDWRSLTQIHETGVRVRNDAQGVHDLQQIFEMDWKIASTGKLPPHRKTELRVADPNQARPLIEVVASPEHFKPDSVRAAESALLELLNSAKKTIQIQLLTYTPVEGKSFWPVIDNALRAAAVSGKKVQMLVSDWNAKVTDWKIKPSDWKFKEPRVSHLKSLDMIPGIEIRVVTIPEHSKGVIPFARVIHSKYLIVDSKLLWVGTSNWSEDYFRNSRNVEVIINDSSEAAKMGEVFSTLWNSRYVTRARDLKQKG